MSKTKLYATQCLAASGFAMMGAVVAYRLRPDLWASGQECAFDFKPGTRVEDIARMLAIIPGVGNIPVLARSTDQLAQRIEWVTGFKVEKIEDEPVATAAPTQAPVNLESQRRAAEKLERLRELANQRMPEHDCARRKEILAARIELERLAA
jgi:hypothetical protein